MLYGNFNRVACIVFFVKIHYLDDSYPAMVVEWSKTLISQIQVENTVAQVPDKIPLGTCDYDGEIVTKKQLNPALTYSIYLDDSYAFDVC